MMLCRITMRVFDAFVIDGLTAICPCCLLPVNLNPHEVVKLNPIQHEPVTNA